MTNHCTRFTIKSIFLAVSLLFFTLGLSARIIYVKPVPVGDSTGSSWSNASTLAKALQNSLSGDSIWVAEGTHIPAYDPFGNLTPSDNRDKTFFIKDNVSLFGGFMGTETLFSQRNFAVHKSILSGDIGTLNDSTDNCYHVVLSINNLSSQGITINGFNIRSGNANGTGTISINGYNVLRNYGAGIYIFYGRSKIYNNYVTANIAKREGGAVYLVNGKHELLSNIIIRNKAEDKAGGILTLNLDKASIVNNLIIQNEAMNGGGMYVSSGDSQTITNNTFFLNNATYQGGAVYNAGTSTFSNNIFWRNKLNENSTRQYSDVYPAFNYYPYCINNLMQLPIINYTFAPNSKGNQFAVYPDFLDTNNFAGNDGIIRTTDDGLNLKHTSVCIESGNSAFLPAGINTDISNSVRIRLNSVDMGAYEFACDSLDDQVSPVITTAVNINPSCSAFAVQFTATYIHGGIAPHFQWTKNGVNIASSDTSTYSLVAGVDFNNLDTIACILTSSRGCLNNNNVVSNTIIPEVKPTKTRLFVNSNASGANTGGDWANAFTDLQSALGYSDCMIKEAEIWVAAGTYKPSADALGSLSPADPRNKTFFVRDGVKLFGGFAGNETILDQRNWKTNITTLSGDIGVQNDSTDNVYHVVLSSTSSVGKGITIDGFTITKGRANVTGSVTINANSIPRNSGAGLFLKNGNNVIKNNLIIENSATSQGAGVLASLGTNHFSKNIIRMNKANSNGGGVYAESNINTFVDNFFISNASVTQSGGGASLNSTVTTLTNNVFYYNTASAAGGVNITGTGNIVNHNVFLSNTGGSTGGLSTVAGSEINNNIFFNNRRGVITLTQGADYTGKATLKGNILQLSRSNYTATGSGTYDLGVQNKDNLFEISPLFADTINIEGPDGIFGTPDDRLRLRSHSPCIDAADSSFLSPLVITDIAGQVRRKGSPDIGPYEFQCDSLPLQVTPTVSLENFSGTNSLCLGDTLKLGISRTYGGFYDTYQWFKNNSPLPGATNAFFTGIAGVDFMQSDTISCTVTSSRSCVTNSAIKSDSLVVSVINPLTRIYVNKNATGANNGLNWTDAFTDLHSALSYPGCKIKGMEIWVAKGVYKPTTDPLGNTNPSDLRNKTFYVADSLMIYGGFAGTETSLTQRNTNLNSTVLSGDIGIQNDSTDNCYHVMLAFAEVSNKTGFLLDGFIIQDGNANVNSSITIKSQVIPTNTGGGVLSYRMNCELMNCSILKNYGGGAVIHFGNSKLTRNLFAYNRGTALMSTAGTYFTVNNNSFVKNQSNSSGGAIAISGLYIYINANSFIENMAASDGGALSVTQGIENNITNNIFANNKSSLRGGAIAITNGINNIANNTFYGNMATSNGGGISFLYGTPYLKNNIFFNNKLGNSATTPGSDFYHAYTNPGRWFKNNVLQLPRSSYPFTNANYGLGLAASGNLFQTYPIFNDTISLAGLDSIYGTADDGLNVSNLSPCIDAGDNSLLAAITTDISGAARIQKVIDIGAFESACDSTVSVQQATAVISIISGNISSCSGKTTTFYLDYTYGGSNPSIQWTKNGIAIPGADQPSYSTIAGVDYLSNDTIACIFTSNRECLSNQVVVSNPLIMIVYTTLSRIYVNDSAAGNNNGSTWADAFNNLQSALEYSGCLADTSVEIWVKAGTYKPTKDPFYNSTPSDPRDKTFFVRDGFKLYGGFEGHETAIEQRNIKLNKTILSGDIGIVDDSSDNCYHILMAATGTSGKGITVDGFTITKANANGAGTITINTSLVSRNSGAGIIIYNGTNTLSNNSILSNAATNNGAGIAISNATNSISYNVINDNIASNGAGIYLSANASDINNNVFYSNKATTNGGAIYFLSGNNTLVNNTIFINKAAKGGGLYTSSGTHSINNNVFWGNNLANNTSGPGADYFRGGGTNAFHHNLLQFSSENYQISTSGDYAIGAAPLNNVFNVSPQFIDSIIPAGPDGVFGTSDDGLKLRNTSSCIDAGNKTYLPVTSTTDFTGSSRINMNNIDIGAYEFACDTSELHASVTISIVSGSNPICRGSAVTLRATTTYAGANATFRWKKNGTNISNATGKEYTAVAGTNFSNGDTLSCAFISSRGCLATTTAADQMIMQIHGQRIFVNTIATGKNTGLNWADAYTSLHNALNNTCSDTSTQIWVAEGTYVPTQNTPGYPDEPRLKMFIIKDGMKVYGGFSGTETSLDQRNLANHPTILSGDIGIPNDSLDNSYHVVLISAPASGAKGALIDGFTITKGQADNGSSFNINGGAVSTGSGGGLYTKNGVATIRNCVIYSNRSVSNGGGLYADGLGIIMSNTILIENHSQTGGGIYTNTGNTTIILTNNVFASNKSYNVGGAGYFSGTSGTLSNNTFYGNSGANSGGGVYLSDGNYTFNHNIFWNNKRGGSINAMGSDYVKYSGNNTFNYNLLQLASSNYPVSHTGSLSIGPTASGNLFGLNPQFIDSTNATGYDQKYFTKDDGFNLLNRSICIDAGNSSLVVSSTDILRTPRIKLLNADIGAYEYECDSSDMITPQVIINITQGENPLCSNKTVTFAATGKYQGTAPSYQWFKNSSSIPGATTTTYSATSGTDFSDQDTISCELVSNRGCVTSSRVNSNRIAMHIPARLSRIYVKANASGLNNGTSWTDAFTSLQSALSVLCTDSNAEVWVATGTYIPTHDAFGNSTPSQNRNKTFFIKDGMKVYGGFTGNETSIEQRDHKSNMTILSGDIGNTNDSLDNSYHVVLAVSPIGGRGITLDGFTIKHGKANSGGNITVNSVLIQSSAGAGIYLKRGINTISNNTILSNTSQGSGGGIYADSSVTLILNNFILNNKSSNGGGAYFSNVTGNRISNNVFVNNSSSTGGGLMFSTSLGLTNSIIANNTFVGNIADNSGAVYSLGNAFYNNILWNNKSQTVVSNWNDISSNSSTTYKNNLFQLSSSAYSSYMGTTNRYNINPLFVNINSIAGADGKYGTLDDGLRLFGNSPCVDRGDSSLLSGSISDITGADRIMGNNMDMGAYEFYCSTNIETPTQPATQLTITRPHIDSTIIHFTKGNGAKRIVVVKVGSPVNAGAINNSTYYLANPQYGSGALIEGSAYVVYNDTGNIVTVNGLNASLLHYVAVFEYNEATECGLYKYQNAGYLESSFTNLGYHYRSAGNVSLTAPGNWEVSADSGRTWSASPLHPWGAFDDKIQIRAPHIATYDSIYVTFDDLVVEKGAILQIRSNKLLYLTNYKTTQPLIIKGKLQLMTGSSMSGDGSLVLEDSAELTTSNLNGFSSIQVAKVFSPSASYIFNGTAAQTINPPAGWIAENVTINNTAGVTLNGAATFNGTLSLLSGTFHTAGNLTLNLRASFIHNGGLITNFTLPAQLHNYKVRPGTTTTLLSSLILTGYLELGTGSLNKAAQNLTLGGNLLYSSGKLQSSGGDLIINGPSQHINLTFSAGSKLNNLTLNRSSSLITLMDSVRIIHSVVPSAGTLVTGNKLILLSDSIKTARITAINSSADITNNVTIQRFIKGGSLTQQGWRSMSSPVSNFNYTQLNDDIFITGPGGPSNGFDMNSTTSSVLHYNESTAGSRGFKSIPAIATTLDAGKGNMVFFMGDRSQSSALTDPNTIPNHALIDFYGSVNKGNIGPLNLSYTNTSDITSDGWNLLGNPYPCELDYSLVNKSSAVSNTYWIINPATHNYENRLASEAIALGQGFFVKVDNTGQTVSFEENDKASISHNGYFKTATDPFAVKMHKDSSVYDIAWLHFSSNAGKGYVFNEDAIKRENPEINMGFITSDLVTVQRNTVNTLTANSTDTFVISTTSLVNGNYWLSFEQADNLPASKYAFLYDLYVNNWINIRTTPVYRYAINNSIAGTKGNRFLLILSDVYPSLPVKITDFAGKRNANTDELTWQTTSEKNISSYEVQRSFNGKDFEAIGAVKARNTAEHSIYNYNAPVMKHEAITYYRLKINELNGKSGYSDQVVVYTHPDLAQLINAQPNPTEHKVEIILSGNISLKQLTVFDVSGRMLQVPVTNNNIDLEGLQSGIYLVRVETDAGNRVIRIVKQ